MRHTTIKAAMLCVLGAAALTLTGCSKTIDTGELQTKIEEGLVQQLGHGPYTVKCKGKLDAKDGATQECATKINDTWQKIDVTASDSDGKFRWELKPGAIPEPTW